MFSFFSNSFLWKLIVFSRDTWLINAEVSYTLVACKYRARTRRRKTTRKKNIAKSIAFDYAQLFLQLNCNCNSIHKKPNRARTSTNSRRGTNLNWELCLWAKIDVRRVFNVRLSVFTYFRMKNRDLLQNGNLHLEAFATMNPAKSTIGEKIKLV